MTMPVTGCSRICAPQPAWAPAWNRSRSSKPSRLNIVMIRGKEPPRAAERVMVVVGPAQAEPVLPGLLHPRGACCATASTSLDLEDQVARQVGRAGQLDHALEQSPRSRRSLFVVVEPPPAACQRSRAARASRAACGFIRPSRASSPGNGSNPR